MRRFLRPVVALAAVVLLAGTACGPTEQNADSAATADATDTSAASRTLRVVTETATIATEAPGTPAAATFVPDDATSVAEPTIGDCVGRCVATMVPASETPIPDEPGTGGAPRVPPLFILPFSAGETLTSNDVALRGYGEPGRGPFPGTRMIIPTIGVDAALEIQVVGANGVMQRASTPSVVAWYDFSIWPGLGGVPLAGGNSVFAGDYFKGGPGVFARLAELQVGAMIHLYLDDGTAAYYRVDFNKIVAEAEGDFQAILSATEADSMTLYTAAGEPVGNTTFTHRRIVWARRLNCDSPKTPTPTHPEQLGCEQPQ